MDGFLRIVWPFMIISGSGVLKAPIQLQAQYVSEIFLVVILFVALGLTFGDGVALFFLPVFVALAFRWKKVFSKYLPASKTNSN
jgi:hypothetical protein